MINASQIATLPAKEKPYKIYDEKGLYLIVNPNGGKWWRMRYRFENKEKLLVLGAVVIRYQPRRQ